MLLHARVLPLLLGFAGAIMGEGRPLAFFKETDSLGRCSMGLVLRMGKGKEGKERDLFKIQKFKVRLHVHILIVWEISGGKSFLK